MTTFDPLSFFSWSVILFSFLRFHILIYLFTEDYFFTSILGGIWIVLIISHPLRSTLYATIKDLQVFI